MTGLRILIADDESHLTQIVSLSFAKVGASVTVVSNGADLLEQATATRPNLIITDYQMPILDGYQACVRLRANPGTADVPVVMLTARGHRLSAAELAVTNIKTLLPKPFSLKQLIAEARKLVEPPATTVAQAA